MVRLDPPRGKQSRLAVLLIDKVEGKTLYMQKAEFIEPSDETGAIHCFTRLRTLSENKPKAKREKKPDAWDRLQEESRDHEKMQGTSSRAN